MTPNHAATCYDALDPNDPARVDTRVAFIRGYTTGWLGGRPDSEGVLHEAAALDGQAYTMGYEAGRVESTTTESEPIAAGGYTAEQEARADAIHAAARLIAGNLSPTPAMLGVAGLDRAVQSVIRAATTLATWIEHGDRDSAEVPFDRHVDEALDIVRGDPELGDRVDQALDAARMAQPRTRPATSEPGP